MKRAKLGDLYCMKVPNGYKLYQWAYHIPKVGDYIRVFPHLYNEIPDNLEEIVDSEHSYIIGFAAGKAYRKKLASLLGNFPVPEKYPFPKYSLTSVMGSRMCVQENSTLKWLTDFVDGYKELPKEFRGVKMISGSLTPDWLMYLFDTDFDLSYSDWDSFLPREQIEKYTDLFDKMMEEAEKDNN
mgnify:CR=1 FL=1